MDPYLGDGFLGVMHKLNEDRFCQSIAYFYAQRGNSKLFMKF